MRGRPPRRRSGRADGGPGVPWARLDDRFAERPEILALSDRAFRLYVEAALYIAAQASDGLVPKRSAPVVRAGDGAVRELVARGLWEAAGDGFLVIGWRDHALSRDEAERQQAKRSQAARRAALARWRGRGPSHADEHADEHAPRTAGRMLGRTGGRNAPDADLEPDPEPMVTSPTAAPSANGAHDGAVAAGRVSPASRERLARWLERYVVVDLRTPFVADVPGDAATISGVHGLLDAHGERRVLEVLHDALEWRLGRRTWKSGIRKPAGFLVAELRRRANGAGAA